MKRLRLFIGVVLCLLTGLATGCAICGDSDKNEVALQGFVKVQQLNAKGKIIKSSKINKNAMVLVSCKIYAIDKSGKSKLIYSPRVTSVWNKEATVALNDNYNPENPIYKLSCLILNQDAVKSSKLKLAKNEVMVSCRAVIIGNNEKFKKLPRLDSVYSNKEQLNRTFESFHYLPKGWDRKVLMKAEDVKFK
ncbi:hypothetical protein AAEX28_07650 [Lentisphaerota bacterium WC36G]|nr:hypothetical protein LJT99_10510 [Lentisphaerae bacterium WC36]